ncbi:MAG TPA: NADH-quinone oxidoreductase subunit N [Sphingobacteriaceae bacterium]
MTDQDLFVLSPFLILAGGAVLIMLLIALKLTHRKIQVISLIIFLFAFISLYFIEVSLPHAVPPLLIMDGFSAFMIGLILFSGLVINIFSYIYFEEKEEGPKEYYVLLLLATLGACTLAMSSHFASLFLGLEILTVGLYALIAYLRGRTHPIEAGIKYLILAAFSSAFLLFGMALIYLETGNMAFGPIAERINNNFYSPLIISGIGMMVVGIGFKLAIVPFHWWAADVYQGAPAPITAFIATASKGGVLAVLLRFFQNVNGLRSETVVISFLFIAIASMIIGNLLALRQNNVKRILAYSSIAHLGYLLVAFLSVGQLAAEAMTFYLVTYFLSSLVAFGVVTLLSSKDHEAEELEDYQGLFWQNPVMAVVFTAALLSLAGIPLTAGFIGKFYVLSAATQASQWLSSVVLVIGSVIGLFYYLRIITAMFSETDIPEPIERKAHPLFYFFSSLVLAGVTFLIVWLGVSPGAFMSFMVGLIER